MSLFNRRYRSPSKPVAFPQNLLLGTTQPAGSPSQSFVLELLLTAILMFVILGISTGAREKGITADIVVGSVIGLEAMFAGPVCGASMNPARSLAPAFVGARRRIVDLSHRAARRRNAGGTSVHLRAATATPPPPEMGIHYISGTPSSRRLV